MMPPIDAIPAPRPYLAGLDVYVPGEQPSGEGYIKLNTNEFPYPAAPEVLEAIQREAADTVRVYPNPTCAALREGLAARHGVEPEQILVGNGSDEILRLLTAAWGGRGRTMAVVEPTYSLYPILAAQFETAVEIHPLEEGGEQLPESLFASGCECCFLALPNPPLGSVFAREAIERLAVKPWLLVIDGAYVDFAEEAEVVDLIERCPNVVVTRTFSKSFGLAGLRVGYAIAHREVIQTLGKLRDSYNVNRISQAAALAALAAEDYYQGKCREIVASRQKLTAALEARGFRVHPSQANFLFARHPEAPTLYARLKERKILVRYFSHDGLTDGLRITIGTPEENEALTAGLEEILGNRRGD